MNPVIVVVIDDAVVMTENIARHLHLTSDRAAAVRAAVQELIWRVTSSTITTVVVFLPLGLLEGVVGQFFVALSVTLTIAVLVSLLLALSVIPLLSAQFVRAGDVEDRPTGSAPRADLVAAGGAALARAVDGLTAGYVRALAAVLRHPRRVVGTAAALVVAGVVIQRFVGTGFLPDMDEGAFVLDYVTPGGTALDKSNRMVEIAEHILAQTPEVAATSRRLGAELGLFATLQNSGDIVARLKRNRSRGIDAVMDDVRAKVQAAVPRMRIEFSQILADLLGDLEGAPRPVEIKLCVPAGEIHTDDRAIGVRVRAPDRVRYDATALPALPVVAGASRQVTPLGALVDIRAVDSRAELLRENQQQMIAMTADLSGRSLGDVMRDVRRVLAANPAPAGIRVVIGGQYAGQQAAFQALLVVLLLAAASVIAVMVIQFESFVEPLIIVLAAPVSFVGATALLLITGTPFNVSSFMGLILLVGLIVKNGIILLDFTRIRLRAGLALEPALLEAARIRLRPILMTTLCTLFGLLPLALGLGAGSELQKPLALAVIGGLGLSTPITLFMVPTLLVWVRGPEWRETDRG